MPSLVRSRAMRAAAMASLAAAGVVTVGLPGAASAQDVNWQVGVASEYVGKGLGKSGGEPSVSGSVEIGAGQAYASVFASTAELSQGAHAEIITTIGWRPTVGAVKLDLAVLNRDLPGNRPGVDSNYYEYQADAVQAFGPVSTRLRVNYTPDGYAATKEAWWIELQGSMALDEKTRASVALADRSADGGADYLAWNAGVKRKLTDQIALDVRWYDTDSHSFGETYEGRLVAALSFSL